MSSSRRGRKRSGKKSLTRHTRARLEFGLGAARLVFPLLSGWIVLILFSACSKVKWRSGSTLEIQWFGFCLLTFLLWVCVKTHAWCTESGEGELLVFFPP